MAIAPEEGTQMRILHLIIERGPITAKELACTLNLTSAAVRRHVTNLEDQHAIEEYEGASSQKSTRGRPSRRFVATETGQVAFGDSYADVAHEAMTFIRDYGGQKAINDFAQARVARIEENYRSDIQAAGKSVEARLRVLAQRLTDDGYAATIRQVPRTVTLQLCQGHCPIQHIAQDFPVLCEAETEAFHNLLGVHVQRLATLADGEHVCTLTIPLGVRTHHGRMMTEPCGAQENVEVHFASSQTDDVDDPKEGNR
ncbi:MAG: MarR family transcriptional regulator [Actinomycetaceae bacterium]|nr:MarR family transcriptional regulator [Actinomycetaceae bacterium]MDY6083239.1 MarR family transcriptional regulator [Actinomycetaceae bacterium]